MTAPTLPPADAPSQGEEAGRPATRVAGLRERVRGIRRRGRAVKVSRQPWVAGILGALWAAVIGLAIAAVPLLVTWMASAESGLTWTESLRVAGLIWVVANGAAIVLGGTLYSLLPWGLILVPLLLLGHAGGWAARRARVTTVRQVAGLALPGATAYAVVAAVVASVTAEPSSRITVLPAAISALIVALVALLWGAVRAAGLLPAPGTPVWLTTSIRAGLVAAATLVGLGALAATVSLVVHIDDAITMTQSLGAGLGGGLGLLLLGAAYTPVLAMWGTAYVMGAGVVIGPGITLSPFLAVSLPADLPPFPLLAALPQETTPLSWLLPLTGVLAGVLAGLVIARSARAEARLVRLAIAGGSSVVAGGVLALGSYLASGGLGDGRLAQVGPVPLTVGILGAVLVVLGAAPSAVIPSPPERPQLLLANDDDDAPAPTTVVEDAAERTNDG